MADLNKKYQQIINELTQKIQNQNELEFVKDKLNELVMEYMSSIDKILEIEKNQVKFVFFLFCNLLYDFFLD